MPADCKMLSLAIIFYLFTNAAGIPASPVTSISQIKASDPILIIVSFDGFRFDYLTKTSVPNFHQVITEGVTVPWIEARFITKTFPNHHSMATGVYEETHGIVSNSFYDPKLKSTFRLSHTGAEWWDGKGATPLYTLNQLNGRRSGGMMWPGTNAWIKNQTCDVFVPYNSSISWHWRMDKVISWITDAIHPVNVVFMYFEEPDSAGHEYGPDSKEVITQIKRADNIVGYLRDQLKKVGLWDKISLIITSDHGMASVPSTNGIVMKEFIDLSLFQMYGSSPVYSIQAKDPAKTELVYQKFYNASRNRAFRVYKKENIPDVYHYRYNDRILPILVVADDHWDIVAESYVTTNPVSGNHGYNNSYLDMHPFFIAHGPQFKRGFQGGPFRNIDIYPLACCLLGLQPAPNNGSFTNVAHLLSNVTLVNACSKQPNMDNTRVDK